VNELTVISVKEVHDKGDILFRKGYSAKHAYLLLIGRVHLKMGEIGHVIHIVSRDVYSTTAECLTATYLRKLHREDLKKLLEKDPVSGLIFFQRLAGMLSK